jgi:hypothetical protein
VLDEEKQLTSIVHRLHTRLILGKVFKVQQLANRHTCSTAAAPVA